MISCIFSIIVFFTGLPEVKFLGLTEKIAFIRNGGFHSSPPYFAGVLLAGFYVIFGLLFYPNFKDLFKNHKSIWWFCLITGLFIIIGIGITQTRGAWIALGISSIICSILIWKQIKQKYLIVIFILLGLIIISIIIFYDQESIKRFFFQGKNSDVYFRVRYNIYLIGIELILKNPIFGSGTLEFSKQFIAKCREFDQCWFTHWHAHNDFLQLMVISGFF